jgi:hypothetical protein
VYELDSVHHSNNIFQSFYRSVRFSTSIATHDNMQLTTTLFLDMKTPVIF